MKEISFVILSWNSEKYLKDCIQSILNIEKYNFGIYIVDNGSIDGSVKIIEAFCDKQIHLIKLEKNYGTTISRNKGLQLIKHTDYICILDSDTIINEQAINVMTEYLEKHNNVRNCRSSYG
ncbi:MAG: glycosyltransferase family 2 protein [Clostridia bacterium]|nr:glycosyltransferase family 2 protein [Clostridia bacterium]